MTKCIFVRDIQAGKEIDVPKKRPGWYRWYAKEEDIKDLFKSTDFYDSVFVPNKEKVEDGEPLIPSIDKSVFSDIDDGDRYYCIYVGIAVNESLYNRIVDWHINGRIDLANPKDIHNKIKKGFLSTLRMSISSLVAGDWSDNDATDKFMGKLIVEYNEETYQIHSTEAIKEIKDIETRQMKRHILPLNIQGNHKDEAQSIIKELKRARKNAKRTASEKFG